MKFAGSCDAHQMRWHIYPFRPLRLAVESMPHLLFYRAVLAVCIQHAGYAHSLVLKIFPAHRCIVYDRQPNSVLQQ